jgi:hypothetical protein
VYSEFTYNIWKILNFFNLFTTMTTVKVSPLACYSGLKQKEKAARAIWRAREVHEIMRKEKAITQNPRLVEEFNDCLRRFDQAIIELLRLCGANPTDINSMADLRKSVEDNVVATYEAYDRREFCDSAEERNEAQQMVQLLNKQLDETIEKAAQSCM